MISSVRFGLEMNGDTYYIVNGDQDATEEYATAAVPTVSGFWTLTEDGTYVLLIESGDATNYAFFAESGDDYDAAYTITVTDPDGEETEVTYSAAGAAEAGTYTVILTLADGYTWTDGTEGSKTFTFTVYYAVELSFNTGISTEPEDGTGTEDDPYVYAYDSTATALFDNWTDYSEKLTAYDAEGSVIEDPSNELKDGLTIRFVLAGEDYAWSDGTRDDRWYTFVSVTKLVDLPTSTTFISSGSMEADENDDYLLTGSVAGNAAINAFTGVTEYTVALNDADGTAVADYDPENTYTFSAAGTYYLVFSLAEDNVWADGTTDDITFTLVIGGNVTLPTSETVIDTTAGATDMAADAENDLLITGSVAGGAASVIIFSRKH